MIPFGEFLPPPFALAASDILLVPIEFVFLHEFASKVFCPRAERKTGGDVSCGAALHAAEAFHVRLPFILVFVRRSWVREFDHCSPNVLVKISNKVKKHRQRRLPVAEEKHPARDISRSTVIELSSHKI